MLDILRTSISEVEALLKSSKAQKSLIKGTFGDNTENETFPKHGASPHEEEAPVFASKLAGGVHSNTMEIKTFTQNINSVAVPKRSSDKKDTHRKYVLGNPKLMKGLGITKLAAMKHNEELIFEERLSSNLLQSVKLSEKPVGECEKSCPIDGITKKDILDALKSKKLQNEIDNEAVKALWEIGAVRSLIYEMFYDEISAEMVNNHHEDIIKSIQEILASKHHKCYDIYLSLAREIQPTDGVSSRYQKFIDSVLVYIADGNLSCDKRFLKKISKTISNIKTYEDPDLCKMAEQFVFCKKYVENFVNIKKEAKKLTDCNL
ncbi:hypothetical protein ENBRE01_0400 [Enteropsectra breve]|nr:hypothetical protein ENBRE01_0400 [Enteropsectra breve]